MLEKSDLEAIKELIDASLDVKLAPIQRQLFALEGRIEVIEERIRSMEEKIDRIAKMTSEDMVALNNELEEIKRKQNALEAQIEKLQMQQVCRRRD